MNRLFYHRPGRRASGAGGEFAFVGCSARGASCCRRPGSSVARRAPLCYITEAVFPLLRALPLTLLLLRLLWPAPARACASCGCGDPTLTALGVERPFKNRVRLSLEQRLGSHRMGGDDNLIARTAVGASWSPTAWLTVLGVLPMLVVRTSAQGAPDRTVIGLGDLELVGRAVVFRERRFAPRHQLSLIAGVKAPTGPRVSDSSGYPAPDDTQPGSGSWDPIVGASYVHYGAATAYASLTGRVTTAGYRGYQRGAGLGASAATQLPLIASLSAVLQADLGYTAADVLPGGAAAPNTGGTLLAFTPGLLWSPRKDWLVRAAVQLPLLQRWSGRQSETPMGVVALIVDL